MDQWNFDPADDLSWGEICVVIAMVVFCLVGVGFIALGLVGLL